MNKENNYLNDIYHYELNFDFIQIFFQYNYFI